MLYSVLFQIAGILLFLGIGAHILDFFDLHFRLMHLIGMENSQGWILALIGIGLSMLSVILQKLHHTDHEA